MDEYVKAPPYELLAHIYIRSLAAWKTVKSRITCL